VRELNAVQSEVNRLFNTLFDAPAGSGLSAHRRWIPPMDLVEHDDEFVLRADLPGLSEKDVNVELEENVLTVSGERKSEHEERNDGYYRVERASGSFVRRLTVPDGIDPSSVTASVEHGVLEVRIPKPEERKSHKVAITVGGGAIEGSGETVDES
jgi:HSP20 family protein